MCHKMMVVAWIDKPSTLLDLGHWDSARSGPLLWVHGQGIIFFGQFWKLGFCSVSECPISAHMGRLCKFLDREHMDSIPTCIMPNHSCMTHRNPVLMHSFHSMPQVGIQQVSLKVCRRWDSTCDKMMVAAWIDKLLTPLDSGHQDSSRGGPLL